MQGKVFGEVYRDKKRKYKEYTNRILYCIAHFCMQALLWVLKEKEGKTKTKRIQIDCKE